MAQILTISRAETWEAVHKAFTQVNFTAYDFNSVKASLVEYLRLNFSEVFNNFIESDELVAFIESFAYVCELLAYRMDMIGNEGMMSTARSKKMVIALAKHLSYRASRCVPARGFLKVVAVRTTEDVRNQYQTSLQGTKILWNDPNDTLWKDNFMAVINRILPKYHGTGDIPRISTDGVLSEIHSMEVTESSMNVFNFSVKVNGQNAPFDLVPVTISGGSLTERRPTRVSRPTLVQRNDGYGDSSANTGFFVMCKQGKLGYENFSIAGTPNYVYNAGPTSINELDVWLNQVDTAGNVVTGGEWEPVLDNTDNIAFNTVTNVKKYEIETQDNDGVSIVFGDGEFASIPDGSFDLWYRTSLAEGMVFTPSDLNNIAYTVSYVDDYGIEQQLTFFLSLQNSLVNASSSESMESIKRNAPKVYSTQNRMVSGSDYNYYPLQNPSIFKLKTINRVFAGASRYSKWSDPTGTYDDVKIFGNDLALFVEDTITRLPSIDAAVGITQLVDGYVNQILSQSEFIQARVQLRHGAGAIRTTLGSSESNELIEFMGRNKFPVYITYDVALDKFVPSANDADWLIKIDTSGVGSFPWTIEHRACQLIAHSDTTKFWNYNSGNVWSYNQAYVGVDTLTMLSANLNKNKTGVLSQSYPFEVTGQPILNIGTGDQAKVNTNELFVNYLDSNSDGVPEYPNNGLLTDICQFEVSYAVDPQSNVRHVTYSGLPTYVTTRPDVRAVGTVGNDTNVSLTVEPVIGADPYTSDAVVVTVPANCTNVTLFVNEYVYFDRNDINTPWMVAANQSAARLAFAATVLDGDTGTLYKRRLGRSNIAFLWSHNVSLGNLVDPATTNIHDMFILTAAQYQGIKQWLADEISVAPTPTSVELHDSYGSMLRAGMLSDTVVMRPAKFKILFGSKADEDSRAQFKVVKQSTSTFTDKQLKVAVCQAIESFFDLTNWDFGETMYFTELSTYIHSALADHIQTVVLVPASANNVFGDLFQINAEENELFVPHVTVDDVVIVTGLNRINLNT